MLDTSNLKLFVCRLFLVPGSGRLNHDSLARQAYKGSLLSGVLESASQSTAQLIEQVCGKQTLYLLGDSATFDANSDDKDIAMRHVKQRTDDWFSLREDGALSSSDLAPGLGFFTLKRAKELQKIIWDKVCIYSEKNVTTN